MARRSPWRPLAETVSSPVEGRSLEEVHEVSGDLPGRDRQNKVTHDE